LGAYRTEVGSVVKRRITLENVSSKFSYQLKRYNSFHLAYVSTKLLQLRTVNNDVKKTAFENFSASMKIR